MHIVFNSPLSPSLYLTIKFRAKCRRYRLVVNIKMNHLSRCFGSPVWETELIIWVRRDKMDDPPGEGAEIKDRRWGKVKRKKKPLPLNGLLEENGSTLVTEKPLVFFISSGWQFIADLGEMPRCLEAKTCLYYLFWKHRMILEPSCGKKKYPTITHVLAWNSLPELGPKVHVQVQARPALTNQKGYMQIRVDSFFTFSRTLVFFSSLALSSLIQLLRDNPRTRNKN
ncbi:hypothetical protein F4810DRAFT_313386 [Camillea tinctor]|nr:hypothetical protein F4810DRAFT_313386 [Camillea tinctor]